MIMCPAVVAEQNRVHLECNLGWQKPQAEKLKCNIEPFGLALIRYVEWHGLLVIM